MNIPLGYEVGSGKPVSIPLKHLAVTGQTQESGKTTTLEALITRSGLRAIAFITKRGEKSFRLMTPIPAYFQEESLSTPYWKFVSAVIESQMDLKMGYRERGWLIKLCDDYEGSTSKMVDTWVPKHRRHEQKRQHVKYGWKKPASLAQLLKNVETALPHQRGEQEMVCMQLREYLRMVVPEIEHAKFSRSIHLANGINVMDVSRMSGSLQALVIRSVIEWVYQKSQKTIVIIPEAWQFIPQGRSTPVKLAAEELIRKGAALDNYVWIDSQDLRGVDKLILRSVGVWIFGVQREKNEVGNTLDSIPDLGRKPAAADIMRLKRGQFFAAFGETCVRVYVQPAGMGAVHAQAIARGEESADSWKQIVKSLEDEEAHEKAKDETPAAIGNAQEAVSQAGTLSDRDEGLDTGNAVTAADDEDGRNDTAKHHDESQVAAGLGVAGAAAASPEGEDLMWKERAEKAEAEILQLKKRLEQYESRGESREEFERDRFGTAGPFKPLVPAVALLPSDVEMIWTEIRQRILADAVLLKVAMESRELEIKVERRVIQQDGSTVPGAIARLVHQGFFKSPRPFGDVRADLIRTGAIDKKTSNVVIGRALSDLNEWGFLTAESTGYQEVAGMKIRIQEG